MLKELYEKFVLAVFKVFHNKKGQTLVEYALLLVLIAIVVYLMLKGAGLEVNNVYSKINSALAQP
jgi:pilus assembly protein Flp/PilA